jgi:hypothetical protein
MFPLDGSAETSHMSDIRLAKQRPVDPEIFPIPVQKQTPLATVPLFLCLLAKTKL